MSENDSIVIPVGVALFVFGLLLGGWFGSNQVKQSEIYVFESRQPFRPAFDKAIPERIDYHIIEWTDAFWGSDGYEERQYMLYYWIEDISDGQELHWTWREVTGP